MSSIPESDKRLIAELEAALERLAETKQNLYTTKPGCACKKDSLCALHSQVWNEITQAENSLARAIGQVRNG